MSERVVEAALQPPDHTERNLAAWSVLAGVLLWSALAGPYFAGCIYTTDDLGEFHLPIRAFYAEQLAQGQPYDWMPTLFCGFYLTGEGQGGAYHPLHQLLYRFLPLRTALAWEYLLPYPLMMLGTWLLLRRRLGRSDAAMFGGLVFAFSSFNLLHFVHPNAIAVIAHIPWLLWAVDVAMLGNSGGTTRLLPGRTSFPTRPQQLDELENSSYECSQRSPIRYPSPRRRSAALAAALIALLTGSQLLLGYPQYVWFSLLAEFGYAIFLQVAYCGRAAQTWVWVVIAKGIGLLLGGVQLLPSIDAWLHSARQGAGAGFYYWGSLDPLNVLQLVAPYTFTGRVLGDNTHEFGLYLGAVPLMLILWVFARRRELGPLKPAAWTAMGFGLLALLLSFGGYGFAYRIAVWLPGFRGFRFPCRYLVLFQLAAAVTAAIGFMLLVRESDNAREQRGHGTWRELWHDFKLPWCVAALSAVVAAVAVALRSEEYIASLPAILVGPMLVAAAGALVVLAARGYRGALVGLVLLTVVDLGYYGLSYSVFSIAKLDEYVASACVPPGEPDGRLVGWLRRVDEPGLRTGDLMTLRGWRRADGYAGLEPERRLDYRDISALRVAGVRWVRRSDAADAIPGLNPCDGDWLEVPDPLPRVRLVTRVQTSIDPRHDINGIRPETTALCEVPLGLPRSKAGRATLVAQSPGRMTIAVDCPASQLLVVAESYHSGWHAAVDAQSQTLYRVNGDFMGCVVGPGKHQVQMTFEAGSLRRGRLASSIGLGMFSVCLFGAVIWPQCRWLPNGRCTLDDQGTRKGDLL